MAMYIQLIMGEKGGKDLKLKGFMSEQSYSVLPCHGFILLASFGFLQECNTSSVFCQLSSLGEMNGEDC